MGILGEPDAELVDLLGVIEEIQQRARGLQMRMVMSRSLRHEKISALIPFYVGAAGAPKLCVSGTTPAGAKNPRIRADFSSMEPHFDPPILLSTVRGVVRGDRQCLSVSFDQGRYNALSLQLFGDCLRALRRNYGIQPGSTVVIGEAEQKKTSILVG